ncbi:MAG: restriction endonuclease subunit S [Akkermansiaceae bacterium]|nr:restriction endonuclease subunit S [Akkermansiaceae bacterium]
MIVKLSDVVDKISGNEDRFSTELEFYLGGEHYESERIAIYKKGIIKEDINILGFKFHFPFKAGDTIFMSRNPHLKKAGLVTYDGICSDTSYILRTKNQGVLLGRFLPLVLQNDRFWRWFEENKSGSVNFLLNWKTLKEYEFDLPHIEEQERIANLAWAIEETRVAYERMLQASEELAKSQFIELFGDPVKNPKNWKIHKLSEIADYFIGLTYKPQDIATKGTIVLRSGNIQSSKLSFEDELRVTCHIPDKLLIKPNDILMCSRNGSAALVGKVALIPEMDEKVTFGAFMTIIRSRYFSYLYIFFQLFAFRKQIASSKTATINQITKAMLDKVSVPIPPDSLLNQFTGFIQQLDKSKFELEQALLELTLTYKRILAENLG